MRNGPCSIVAGFLAKDVTACLDRRCALGLVQIIMNLAALIELYIFWS